MSERDPAQPIADEMVERRRRTPPVMLRRDDKLRDYKERTEEADWVPEPPTY